MVTDRCAVRGSLRSPTPLRGVCSLAPLGSSVCYAPLEARTRELSALSTQTRDARVQLRARCTNRRATRAVVWSRAHACGVLSTRGVRLPVVERTLTVEFTVVAAMRSV